MSKRVRATYFDGRRQCKALSSWHLLQVLVCIVTKHVYARCLRNRASRYWCALWQSMCMHGAWGIERAGIGVHCDKACVCTVLEELSEVNVLLFVRIYWALYKFWMISVVATQYWYVTNWFTKMRVSSYAKMHYMKDVLNLCITIV